MPKHVTMEDIANELGVSKNAVSLALRGKEGVGESLRQKIIEKAVSLNYGGMSKMQQCILALVPTRISLSDQGSFYQQLCFHMEEYAKKLGYQLLICSVTETEEQSLTLPACLNHIDCNKLMTIGNFSLPYCEMINGLGKHYLLVDNYYDSTSVSCITTANLSGAYQLTRHLIENGHKQIQFFGMYRRTSSLRERWIGYMTAMMDHNLPVLHNSFIDQNDVSGMFEPIFIEAAFEQMEQMPTAIVCGHDTTAFWVKTYLEKKGIRCPEDYSIVGFDNIPWPQIEAMNLTTYQTPKVEIAQTAIDYFMQPPVRTPRRIQLFGEIIYRNSVKDIRRAGK